MMRLYWSPRTRSLRALWMLEEAGVPYERVLVDIQKGGQNDPAFRRINPMGKVPAFEDGSAQLAESAAICAYIAERCPEAEAGAAARRSRARTIFPLAVLRARLHRTGARAEVRQFRNADHCRRLGRFQSRVQRSRGRAGGRALDPRQEVQRRRRHDRLRSPVRGRTLQDRRPTAGVRRLSAAVPRPARRCSGRWRSTRPAEHGPRISGDIASVAAAPARACALSSAA